MYKKREAIFRNMLEIQWNSVMEYVKSLLQLYCDHSSSLSSNNSTNNSIQPKWFFFYLPVY